MDLGRDLLVLTYADVLKLCTALSALTLEQRRELPPAVLDAIVELTNARERLS